MKRYIKTGLLLSFFFLLVSQKVSASCIPMSLQEYKDRADVVVAGKVTEIEDNNAVIRVDKLYKGEELNEIYVRLPDSQQPTSIDFPLEWKKSYLLFLKKQQNSKIMTTDACAGSREETTLTSQEAAVLGKGGSPVTPTEATNLLPTTQPPLATLTPVPETKPASNNTQLVLAVVALVAIGGFIGWKMMKKNEEE